MIMLDKSPAQLEEYTQRYDFGFWQLQTPISRRALAGVPYGLDNGCFAQFLRPTWERQLAAAREKTPVFVCLPDIVGDARRTLELFHQFKKMTEGLPRALVLQDGIGDHDIPWNEISAVFVGGTDRFKLSTECINACKAAKYLGRWVHVGRVNTTQRVVNWMGLGDSIDGSGISKYDHMLEDVLSAIRGESKQEEIFQ